MRELRSRSKELEADNRREDALALLRGALASDPSNVQLLTSLVKTLDSCNQTSEAEAEQRKFLDRTGHPRVVGALISRLSRLWRHDEAISFGQAQISQGICDQRILSTYVRACVTGLGLGAAKERFEWVVRQLGVDPIETLANAELLMLAGNLVGAENAFRELQSTNERFVAEQASRHLHELEVLRTSLATLNSVTLKGPLRGVAFLPEVGSSLAQLWQVPLAAELRRRGFATIVPEVKGGGRELEPTGIDLLDELQGILDDRRVRLTSDPEGRLALRHDWQLDLAAGTVEAEGIDIYDPICARIGTKLRRMTFDLDHPLAQAMYRESLFRGDVALEFCNRLARINRVLGLPVRILSGMTHYSPAFVYRKYCDLHSDQLNMEYVAFVAGYEHYYTNLGNKYSTALSVQNMTRHPDLNSPARVHRSQFENWMSSLSDRQSALADVKKVISLNRAGGATSPESAAVERRIRAHRAKGGGVACLFGKILYDIWMDQPSGPAHEDISDWVNHTIESVNGTDTLLLIKPHPNEIKQHIARPDELFFDLIKAEGGDNVILLDHRWFNMDAIAGLIDLGIVWSGTSSLELQASGIPVVVCGDWGLRDHPVQFLSPGSRKSYEDILLKVRNHKVDLRVQEECALLIKYYSTEDVLIPYCFGTMPYQVGAGAFEVKWDQGKIADFLVRGDVHVSRLADRVA